MTFRPTIIERAYQLAASGDFRFKNDIALALNAEGFSSVREQLDGRSITKALRELCQKNIASPCQLEATVVRLERLSRAQG